MLRNSQDALSSHQNDELIFAPEDEEIVFAEETERSQPEESWKILIVDDDVEVHEVTKLALGDFILEGKSLTFISAYSAQEAKQLIQAHSDTAIIFLDVVMETENAGLQVVKYIREELGNQLVRIILRTGQPGRAPENVVAVSYGIDDYKTKTELTAQKLFIAVVTALRAFSTLMKLLQTSRDLKLEVVQHEQVEASLQMSEMNAREKVRQLEQALQALQQAQLQSVQRERVETLSQLVTEMTQEIINSPNQASGLYTMSIITRIARMVLRITDEHSAKLGISQSKLAVLIYLSNEPELCASPSSLAKYCGVSRAAMTGLLDGLEQEGYVERANHPSDRRALMVRLTVKGQQFLEWITPQDQAQRPELISTLDEAERKNLIELVMKVIKLFEDPAPLIADADTGDTGLYL
jgi:DNA-binding MarR family transcriptional regulator/CheY-like chemotaxis protein